MYISGGKGPRRMGVVKQNYVEKEDTGPREPL